MDSLIDLSRVLAAQTGALRFSGPVFRVYNPLEYAQVPHELYLSRYGAGRRRVLFWGMNPGPWGMAQTGVPFGEVAAVRDWMGITGTVSRPADEHPKRPVDGFSCGRSEVSGRRLWGLMARRFGSADAFFEHHLVMNYCPLLFMEESGRNLTPDRLPASERRELYDLCDRHLSRVLEVVDPEWAIGIGNFALSRIRAAIDASPGRFRELRTASILHPSPASPRANRDWDGEVARALVDLGVWS